MAGLGTHTTALHKIADGKNGLNKLLTLLLRSFARSESESRWHCIEFISVGNYPARRFCGRSRRI